MAFSQTQFQNAHHLEFNGGQFFNVAHSNATIINSGSSTDPVSTTLWHHVAAGAIFDSAERYPPGKCHPGTREKMIERIMTWIDDPDPTQRILWVHGPAGCGKSALAHTICELIRQADADKCCGTFFFARGLTDRGKGVKLFVTLSYQLAVQFPAMRAEINEALSRDPSLPTKSMDVQLFYLIVQPLLRCRTFPSHSPTLIIDGLDECADDQGIDTQRTVINLISQSIVEYNIPLRFIVASRPESWIRDTFETSPLPNITLSLSLRDDEDADDDIRAYLTDGFEQIRVENIRVMGSVSPPWPPANIVDRFVYEASGQYIYASTVLRFVGKSSRFTNPQEQLLILLSPGLHRALAFSELDRLYERIVSRYPRWVSMKRVLSAIFAETNLLVVEHILKVDPTEIAMVLDALSPLIDIDKPGPLSEHELLLEPIIGPLLTGQNVIRICHLSFREFLEDESRSGAFHIDIRGVVKEISHAFFGIIHQNLDQNYAIEPHISLEIGLVEHQTMMSQMAACPRFCEIETLLPLINGMTRRLRLIDLPWQTNRVECFVRDMAWLESSSSEIDNRIQNGHYWPWPRTMPEIEPSKANEAMDTILDLQEMSFIARRKGIGVLASSTGFQVTPTIAYIHECESRWSSPVTMDELFSIPGQTIPDVISTFQQHGYILRMYYNIYERTWRTELINLDDDGLAFSGSIFFSENGWRTRGKWKQQRISLAYQYMKITLNNVYNEQNPYGFLGDFFAAGYLSDILGWEYFHDPCNLSILTLITNYSAWTYFFGLEQRSWEQVANLITPVLCWLNRHLTDPEKLKLLEDYDKNLVSTMRSTMKQIFESLFLPNFRSSAYYSALCISTPDDGTTARSIKITVFSLNQIYYYEEEISYFPYESLHVNLWRPLHDNLFAEIPTENAGTWVINSRDWHPHLAARLLNALVKLLYRKINPNFQVSESEELSEGLFAYIIVCLPHAETTQQNLDSLRAIIYLFPNASLGWDLPGDFWSLSVEFLKKYDRSMLSAEEFVIFEQWMHSGS